MGFCRVMALRVEKPAIGALVGLLEDVRRRTVALVEDLDDQVMHRSLGPVLSPLVWDLAHIAAYEDLWCVHRLGGEPLLHSDLAETYDAFDTPRSKRTQIELLDRPATQAYLDDVRTRTLEVLHRTGPQHLHELVLRHELQHTETMRQALFLGRLPGGRAEAMPALDSDTDWIEVPAGTAWLGARHDCFAYDNERPRHALKMAAFRIARTPVTNASWLGFTEGGGYQRRE